MNISLELPIDQVNLALLGLNQLHSQATNAIAAIQRQAQAQLALIPPQLSKAEKAGGTD